MKWKPYIPGLVLLVASCILTFFIYKDYGISWDEELQREIGLVSYDFVFKHDSGLNTFIERDHGVGFELPLVIIEKALHLTDTREIYLMRHLVTNLFFLVCMFIGYVLIYKLFRNRTLACLGFLILAFTPRMFAHSFFNSKDIPFLSMFLVSLAAAWWAFRRDRPAAYLVLGLVVGYTTSIRLLSIMLAGILLVFLCIDIATAIKRKYRVRQKLFSGLLFITGCCLAIYICWPYLWHRPLYNFAESYKSMSHFRWDSYLLFKGIIYSGNDLPWYYIPVWFCITTPVLWLALGLLGTALLPIALARRPLQLLSNTAERNFVLYFVTLCVPVLMVIALHSVVYDDWRHLYFIYPSFVLLALYGLHRIWTPRTGKYLAGLSLLQLIIIAVFMIRNHPHQQVYFNQLVAHKEESIRRNYELDYWGCANKQALEYILRTDTSGHITVNDWPTVRYNLLLLPAADRRRVTAIPADDHPDYQVRFFRTYELPVPEGQNIYNIKVLNSTIMSVYKKEK